MVHHQRERWNQHCMDLESRLLNFVLISADAVRGKMLGPMLLNAVWFLPLIELLIYVGGVTVY